MDKVDILKEVNRLITTGLRKSAIDIIQEYLEKKPNDTVMCRALGRIYLLEKKPDLAVKYLQLALKNSDVQIITNEPKESYQLDDLNEDDLAYISGAGDTSENTYPLTGEAALTISIDTLSKETKRTLPLKSPSNSIISGQNVSDKPQDISSEVAIIDSKNTENHTSSIEIDLNQNVKVTTDFSESLHANKIDYSNHSGDLFMTTSTVSSKSWQNDLFSDEEEIIIDDYIHDDFEIDAEEETVIVSEIEDDIIEAEFSWDDLDEFDELDDQDPINLSILTEGKLNRSERAKQIAIEIINTYDWGNGNLRLLQEVFMENGWATARVSIERELNKGLIPEELQLALFIRQLWAENQQYWISFIHLSSTQDGQQTRAAYKNMSWPESLRIIRSFTNTPSEEEIQFFMDQVYDDWYSSAKLQRQYRAFIRYLKYRTGSVRGTLPGKELFSFIEASENGSLLDNGYNFINYASGIEKLRQEGIDIELILAGIEQKYAVFRPEGDFGDPAVYGDR